jgi:ubiquinone biosynthesis protein COQ4
MASSIRNHPVVAFRALLALAKDPDDLPTVFKVIENLPGRAPYRLIARMKASPNGARLLATRPDLAARLADRAALHALPAGTLGRAYAEFCDRAGITPQGIIDASMVGMSAAPRYSEDIEFTQERMRDTHDLWHVVTGYGTDVVGELALLAFTVAQTRHPGIALICALALVYAVPGVSRVLREGYRRGARAAWFPDVAWEELLDRPLDEVRARLGIGALPVYTPMTSDALRAAGIIPTQGAAS